MEAQVAQASGYRRPVGARPRARDRFVAHLRAGKLDRALAGGASVDSGAALAIRAGALTSAGMRRSLGQTVERLLAPPSEPPSLGLRLSPRRDRVAEARDDLDLLARRLLVAPRVEARGVALVRLLLSDGAGPLFSTGSNLDLRAKVREAIAALDPAHRREPGEREIR